MGAINRRQAFLLGGGFVALTVLPMAANAEPSNDAAELIKKFIIHWMVESIRFCHVFVFTRRKC